MQQQRICVRNYVRVGVFATMATVFGVGCGESLQVWEEPSTHSNTYAATSNNDTNVTISPTTKVVGGAGTVTTLTGSSQTFTVSKTGASYYWWIYIGTTVGGNNIKDSGKINQTAGASANYAATGLPQNGSAVYVRVWYSDDNSTWSRKDFEYKAQSAAPPSFTSPTSGSTLSGSNVTFSWAANGTTGITNYWLYLGSSAGANDIHDSGNLFTTTSRAVTGIPVNGSTVHGTLFYSTNNGTSWSSSAATFTAFSGSAPSFTTPTPGSTLAATTQTFTWVSGGSGATEYWFYLGNTAGMNDIKDSGSLGTNLSYAATGLPQDGRTMYATLFYKVGGSWLNIKTTFIAKASANPAITSPAPGATLSGSLQSFTWAANGQTVQAWWLYAGTATGDKTYYDSGQLASTTLTRDVTGLPTNGNAVVMTLFWQVGGVWNYQAFNYVAAASGAQPIFTLPVAGSTLTDSAQTFAWISGGLTITNYWLYVGLTVGNKEIHDSGDLGTATTKAVTGIPTNGVTLHATLFYKVSGSTTWQNIKVTFVAKSAVPSITSPVGGSTLTGTSVSFTWTGNGASVTDYWLYAGTTEFDKTYYDSGSMGVATNKTVTGLPSDASTVVITLYYKLSGATSYSSITASYTAIDGSSTLPAITSPAPGTTSVASIPGSTATFTWSDPTGNSVTGWWLFVGSIPGGKNFYDSGTLAANVLSRTVTSLPLDGRVIYVRLFYKTVSNPSVWQYIDYTYFAYHAIPSISSPAASSTLSGPTVTFTFTKNGANVLNWQLYVGTATSLKNIWDSGVLTGATTSEEVTVIPIDGSKVYVRLWYKISTAWAYKDFTYTAFDSNPGFVSPTPGGQLNNTTVTFTWTADQSTISNWQLYLGSSVGGSSYWDSGVVSGATLSQTVSGLPFSGQTIYARLHYKIGATWYNLDTTFAAVNTSPGITAPVPGGQLTSYTATFTWSPQLATVANWQLYVGTSAGANNLWDSGVLSGATLSQVVNTLQYAGQTMYVRLYYKIGTTWNSYNTTYTAVNSIPRITSPLEGSTFSGNIVTFFWTSDGAPITTWFLYVGSTLGGYNYHSSGNLSSATLSRTVSGLPTNGTVVNVRLWYQISGIWYYKDTTYFAAKLTCQGKCGGQASLTNCSGGLNVCYCYCDSACLSYGDCCTDKFTYCP